MQALKVTRKSCTDQLGAREPAWLDPIPPSFVEILLEYVEVPDELRDQ